MGQHVLLRGAATPERGAAVADVTMTVPEEVRRAALLAAAEDPGPVTGVDCLAVDAHRGSSVATVSVGPELHLHALPEHDRRREVGDALLGAVFAGAPATIPTMCLVGERGTRSVARVLERFLRASHSDVALALPQRASIHGIPLERTACGSHPGPAFLLGDPRTTMLVATMSSRRVVERGIGLDRCNVAAILGAADGPPSEAYRAAVDVCLAAAQGGVVVGADNPLLEEILALIAPARAFVAARRRADPALPGHLAAGRAVVRPSEDRTAIELQRGNDIVAAIPIAALQGAEANAARRGRGATLYAAAVALALGISGDRSTAPRDRHHLAAQPD